MISGGVLRATTPAPSGQGVRLSTGALVLDGYAVAQARGATPLNASLYAVVEPICTRVAPGLASLLCHLLSLAPLPFNSPEHTKFET